MHKLSPFASNMFHAKLRILHLQLQQRVLRRHRPVAHGRNMGAETW